MKNIIISFTLFLTMLTGQSINWATSFDGAGNDFISDMSTDNSGNTYVVGQFGADITVNGTTYSPQGLQDMFWAKIGSDGSVNYFHHIEGPGDERGRGIDVDNMGNIYILGRFSESLFINNGTVNNIGGGINGFVIKYNSSFEYQWYSPFNSFTDSNSGNIYPLDLVANKENGGCYVTFTWDGYISFAGTLNSPVDHDGNQVGQDGAVVKINNIGSQVGYALVKHESNIILGSILNRNSIVYGGNGEIYIWGYAQYNSEYYGSLGLGYSGTGNPSNYYPSYEEEFQCNNSQNNSSANFFLSYDWDGDHPNLNWMGRYDSESRHNGGFPNVSYSDGHLLISQDPHFDGVSDPIDFQIWTNPIDQFPAAIIDDYNLFYGAINDGTIEKQLGIIDIDVTNNNQPNILRHVTGVDVTTTAVGSTGYPDSYINPYDTDIIFTELGYQFSGTFKGTINDVTSAGYVFDPTGDAPQDPDDLYRANIDFNGLVSDFTNLTNTANTDESFVAGSLVGSNYIISGYLMGQGMYGTTSIGTDTWTWNNSNNNNYATYVLSFGSGSIDVLSPNGGEVISTGSNFEVTWETTGDQIVSVNIDLSTDGGTNWQSIENNIPNSGMYSWTTPNILSTNCLVRISDTNSDIKDQSDDSFTLNSIIEIMYPNGGEQLVVGDVVDLQWNTEGIVENVNIQFSSNSGGSWDIVENNITNNGSYEWTVPSNEVTTCKIKIIDASNSALVDESDANFTIYAPSISLNNISGPFEITQSVNLSWTTVGDVQLVDILISDNNGGSYDTISTNLNNINAASFDVPIDYIDENIIIKVAASLSPSVYDITQSTLITPTDDPKIISILDSPDDDGHYVDIVFTRSKYDGSQNGAEIYTVYRQMSDGVWQASNSMDASGLTYYNAMGTTFAIDDPTSFKILATMGEGTFSSPVFSGTSIDNIAPSVPEDRVAVLNGVNLNLSWSPSVANDFSHYSIYGGENENDFQLLQNTTQNEIQINYQNGWYYGVATSDHSGNQSDVGYFDINVTASIDESLIPKEIKLIGNFPNPFNPSTKVSFRLGSDGFVKINIYDMKGMHIADIVNGFKSQGLHNVIWNSTDKNGYKVSAGVYLYTIESGNFRQTKKMVLLK